jgi:hypothetical protein
MKTAKLNHGQRAALSSSVLSGTGPKSDLSQAQNPNNLRRLAMGQSMSDVLK